MTGPFYSSTENEIDTKIKDWLRNLRVKPDRGRDALIEIFKLLYTRLNHDNELLLGKWDVELFENIEKNLKYIRNKVKELLDQKIIVENWGEKWMKMMKDFALLLEQSHRQVYFKTRAVLDYLEAEENRKKKEKGTITKSRLELLDEEEKLHEKFQDYSLKYEHLVNDFARAIPSMDTE